MILPSVWKMRPSKATPTVVSRVRKEMAGGTSIDISDELADQWARVIDAEMALAGDYTLTPKGDKVDGPLATKAQHTLSCRENHADLIYDTLSEIGFWPDNIALYTDKATGRQFFGERMVLTGMGTWQLAESLEPDRVYRLLVIKSDFPMRIDRGAQGEDIIASMASHQPVQLLWYAMGHTLSFTTLVEQRERQAAHVILDIPFSEELEDKKLNADKGRWRVRG